MYPTPAKAFAALAFGGLVWWICTALVTPLFPEGFDHGSYHWWAAGLAVVFGWRVVGARAGVGYLGSFGNGLTAGLLCAIVPVLALNFWNMLHYALAGRFIGLGPGVQFVIRRSVEHWQMIARAEIVLALFGGALLIALVAAFMARVTR